MSSKSFCRHKGDPVHSVTSVNEPCEILLCLKALRALLPELVDGWSSLKSPSDSIPPSPEVVRHSGSAPAETWCRESHLHKAQHIHSYIPRRSVGSAPADCCPWEFTFDGIDLLCEAIRSGGDAERLPWRLGKERPKRAERVVFKSDGTGGGISFVGSSTLKDSSWTRKSTRAWFSFALRNLLRHMYICYSSVKTKAICFVPNFAFGGYLLLALILTVINFCSCLNTRNVLCKLLRKLL